MADNVGWTEGSGKTLATDEIGGVQYPRSKISIGADGSATDLAFGQAAAAASLPVVLASDQPAIDVNATVEIAEVTVTDSALPTGAATSAKQDTGNTSLASIDGKLTACNTGAVTISAALPAGTNAIGKLAANSGIDIGDVDVTSVVPGTGATSLGKAEDAAHSDGDTGVMALAVRKNTAASTSGSDGDYQPLITNTTGHLWVDASGQTLTVASHAVTNAGTFVTQEDGAALTSLQLIDDVVHSGDAALSKYAVIGAVRDDTSTGTVTENQANALRMSSRRALLVEGVASGTAVTVSASNLSCNIAQMNGVATTMGNGASGTGVQRVTIASDSTGNIATIGTSVTPGTAAANLGKAEDAGHNTGDVGVMALGVRAASPTDRSAGPTDGDYEPFALNEVGAVWTTLTPSANGGCSIFRSLDLDETEEDVKTSAGVVYGMWVTNTATSTRFIKFYNATAANVTVGSTTPVITWGIPGNSSDDISAVFGGGFGIGFGTAICVAATTGVADNDTGAPGANEVIVNIFYK